MSDLRSVVQQAADDPETQAQASDAFRRNQRWAKPAQSYQTPLSPQEEQAFRGWAAGNKVPFNADDPNSDYDMRGYWKDVAAGGTDARQRNDNDGRMHFPDTYKTPFHSSFSNESKYALPTAPRWANDHQLVDQQTGKVVFDERAAGR